MIRVTGLPDSVRGIWSLWEISLAAEGLRSKRFLPVFINGRAALHYPLRNALGSAAD